MADELPAHSPLGASSSERWIECSGSVALIDAFRKYLGPVEEEDPDYRRDGVQAHALAAHCLETGVDAWEADREAFPDLTVGMMVAVQDYVDFISGLGDVHEEFIEHRVHRPEIHQLFYGTLDYVAAFEDHTHIVDYKHGVGVVVDVEHNSQLQYYARGFISSETPDDWPVKLTIVQPRAYHPDGTIRTWETTAGEIRRWADTVLLPAMEATREAEWLAMGSWCRFCPAKPICPAMHELAQTAVHREVAPAALARLEPAELAKRYAELSLLKMYVASISSEVERRVLAGETIATAKLVKKKMDRAWNAGAVDELVEVLGRENVFETKIRSPAQIEGVPGGKRLVAKWAYQPDGGLTVAPITDKRKAQAWKSDEELMPIPETA